MKYVSIPAKKCLAQRKNSSLPVTLGVFRYTLGKTDLPFPEQYLEIACRQFSAAGFELLDAQECFRPIKFFDIGALVWFARIIEWEFSGFSVDRCMDNLLRAQRILEENGCIEGRIHRFLLVGAKR